MYGPAHEEIVFLSLQTKRTINTHFSILSTGDSIYIERAAHKKPCSMTLTCNLNLGAFTFHHCFRSGPRHAYTAVDFKIFFHLYKEKECYFKMRVIIRYFARTGWVHRFRSRRCGKLRTWLLVTVISESI